MITLLQVVMVLTNEFSDHCKLHQRYAVTCRTIGSCSGGLRFSLPYVNQTWNAVSCSAKNGLCSNAKLSLITFGSWARQWSRARSHACLYHHQLLTDTLEI